MADNILDAASQRDSPQAAKRMREDTDHEDGTSVPPSSLKAEVFVDPEHPNRLLEGLNRLRLNRFLCDVILVCEGQEVPCHRHVLASFSPYFEAMFTSGMRESTQDRVTISGLEPQMIGLLVNYAYTSKVSISADNVQALLAASDLLEVTSVREACCEYMKRHLDVNNCVEFYCSADDHSCGMLKKHILDHILEHFSVLYQKEEFLSLSVERLTEVLSSDHLNVPEEDMVFEAAMLWLDKSPTHRQSFGQVLEHIRLPLISPSYLHTVVESLEVVKEQPGCQRFISEAKGEQPYSNTARPRRVTVIVTLEHAVGHRKAHTFDPLTGQWKTLCRLPTVVHDYAVVASGSSLYLAGGQFYIGDMMDPLYVRETWSYSGLHNSDSWLRKANMNEPRHLFSLVMLDGCVFAVGGRGSERSEDSMEKYDPHTDSWRLMESVGVAAHYDGCDSCNVVALDGHLYFIGGAPGDGEEPGGRVAKYNPVTSVWTQLAPMLNPRDKSAACVLNGKIYVTGGEHYRNGPITSMMERYDPQCDQWTMCASMQVKRISHGVAVVDGRIYALGGRDYSGSDHKVECYCERRVNSWETVGRIPLFRFHLKCVSLKLRRDHGQPSIDQAFEEDHPRWTREPTGRGAMGHDF